MENTEKARNRRTGLDVGPAAIDRRASRFDPTLFNIPGEIIQRRMALLPDVLPSEGAIRPSEEPVDTFDLSGHGCPVELTPVGAVVDDDHKVVGDCKYRMQVSGKFGEF